MLPDLRVLLLATVTTFLLATGVGLFASVRLLPDPLAAAHPDRDTPISRVALSWQDLNRGPLREITPAVIERDIAPDVSKPKETVAPQPKAEDRPFAAPAAENAAPSSSTSESVAVKTETAPASQPKDEPATTGAIAETPSAPIQSSPPKFAARPEPVEATSHAEPAHVAAPVTPPKARKAKADQRKARRARVARQASPQSNSPAEPASNFFTDFGSRAR